MTSQQRHIGAMLAAAGWRIVQREQPSDPWWLDELWEGESVWAPVGTRCFVSFLVDPQAPPARRPGEHVWAVAIGRTLPAEAMTGREVPLRPRWEADGRSRVAQLIAELRTEIPTEPAQSSTDV